ncbi:MAG: hypothetical protein ACR2GN_06760 [Bacteroidia bacterium]
MKVALIIIYNHQFNKNIEVLERIYRDRFSHIYHLVPFYMGDKSNVIPVYDSSHYFQGYIAQGLKSFFKNEFDHYFFIADDLILNPTINERNYTVHLRLKQGTCYLPNFITLHEREDYWLRVGEAYHYNINLAGVEAKDQLPGVEIALQKFKHFGLKIKPLKYSQIWKTPKTESLKELLVSILRNRGSYFRYIKSKFTNIKYSIPYPIVGSYSDVFVVSSDSIRQFCHYCGVFAATRLFVEVAIPTSLVLSAQEIVTENDLKLNGKALWTKEQFRELDKYEQSLQKLFEEFPPNYLYLHPIKLSKWNTDL